MSTNWTLDLDADRVAWLTCDMAGASTNVLSGGMVRELAAKLGEVAALNPLGVVVKSGKRNGFIAGADIKEFLSIRTPAQGYELVRAGQSVLQQLQDLPFPSVAALHGFALGGGLELALACTYRVGADDAALSLGLPEVLLGIHPGFGGTVRGVQLIGVRPALELMLKGRPSRGARALSLGLLDELVAPAELATRAKSLVLRRPREEIIAIRREAHELERGAAAGGEANRSGVEAQRPARALPCSLCHRGSVAAVWRRRCGRL